MEKDAYVGGSGRRGRSGGGAGVDMDTGAGVGEKNAAGVEYWMNGTGVGLG